MVHVLQCISYAPLNLNITLPSPPPNTVIFKAILGRCVIICDIAWHVPEDCLSSLSLLSPSVSRSLSFLPLSNQKAKPCRQLRANNKSLPVECLKMTEQPGRRGREYTLIVLGLQADTIFQPINLHQYYFRIFWYCCFCCHPRIWMCSYLYCYRWYGPTNS